MDQSFILLKRHLRKFLNQYYFVLLFLRLHSLRLWVTRTLDCDSASADSTCGGLARLDSSVLLRSVSSVTLRFRRLLHLSLRRWGLIFSCLKILICDFHTWGLRAFDHLSLRCFPVHLDGDRVLLESSAVAARIRSLVVGNHTISMCVNTLIDLAYSVEHTHRRLLLRWSGLGCLRLDSSVDKLLIGELQESVYKLGLGLCGIC